VYDTLGIYRQSGRIEREAADHTPGYDAETTINRQALASLQSVTAPDIWLTMDSSGKNVKRLTNELGYDGGPFWSMTEGNCLPGYTRRRKRADYTSPLKQNWTVRRRILGDERGRSNKRQTKLNSAVSRLTSS
jgi:hypothetical protein